MLRRDRGPLGSATVRVVSLSGAAWLLMTAAIFGLAWPLFTHMRNQRIWYHHMEEPYTHDASPLGQVALCTLPLFLLLLGTGSAALQTVCSRAVAAGSREPSREDSARAVTPARVRPVLAVYALRSLIVWPLPVIAEIVSERFTGYQLDSPLPLERGSLPYTLVEASPVAAVCVAVVLRLALGLAPAAAADGLGPLAALRRSWSLMWTRAGGVRVLALALPLAVLSAGVVRLVVQVALPLRPLVRSLLEQATGNFFAAYYAGILAPVIVGVLVGAAVALPVTFTAFAALYDRLGSPRTSSRGAGGTAESTA
ncbi:hypothetical protein ACFVW8_20920 [Streptomyces sp. NPDC058221]|uniref:hypothetical protein n=1 Tax=Streptomyces sp. NPDC058221 TaxID=3346388 RepID=UPI0036E17C00